MVAVKAGPHQSELSRYVCRMGAARLGPRGGDSVLGVPHWVDQRPKLRILVQQHLLQGLAGQCRYCKLYVLTLLVPN